MVIVNYNTCDDVRRCLASLYAQTDPALIAVTVVDNASSDGSVDTIRHDYPQVNVVASPTNLGFAAGCNLGAAERDDPYIFFLNPDTVILDRAIERLLQVAKTYDAAGIWGPRVLFENGQINTTHCFRDFSLWSLFCSTVGLTAVFPNSPVFNSHNYGGWDRSNDRNVDAVSGCALLIKTALWRDLDGFDPIFFMYAEEADLCIRARTLGAQPRATAQAEIIHHTAQSYSERTDMWVDLFSAKITLIYRHFSGATKPLARGLVIASPLVRIAATTILDWIARDKALSKSRLWKNIWRRRHEWKNGFAGKGNLRTHPRDENAT